MRPQDGSQHSANFNEFYAEMKVIAGNLLRKERPNHTLQRTALANEAYLRLIKEQNVENPNARMSLANAVRQMRNILVDYGRKRQCAKRGGGQERIPLLDSDHSIVRDEESFLALNEVLDELGRIDSEALMVVELKFFGGLTNREIADELGTSESSVSAIWLHARLWMYQALAPACALTGSSRRA